MPQVPLEATTKTVLFVDGVPRSVIERLDEIADSHERSRSGEVRHLLGQYIKQQQSPTEPAAA